MEDDVLREARREDESLVVELLVAVQEREEEIANLSVFAAELAEAEEVARGRLLARPDPVTNLVKVVMRNVKGVAEVLDERIEFLQAKELLQDVLRDGALLNTRSNLTVVGARHRNHVDFRRLVKRAETIARHLVLLDGLKFP